MPDQLDKDGVLRCQIDEPGIREPPIHSSKTVICIEVLFHVLPEVIPHPFAGSPIPDSACFQHETLE